MRITENRLRSIIRSVIKESRTVPDRYGIRKCLDKYFRTDVGKISNSDMIAEVVCKSCRRFCEELGIEGGGPSYEKLVTAIERGMSQLSIGLAKTEEDEYKNYTERQDIVRLSLKTEEDVREAANLIGNFIESSFDVMDRLNYR